MGSNEASSVQEDAEPLSHPIRSDSNIAMNNFYTATLYNKGASTYGTKSKYVFFLIFWLD